MRADLLVVHGDPAASAADLERIDHVFLGGVEVDRPALLAKIRAFDAPPSTTAAPATATNAGEKARAAEPEKGKGGAASSRRRRDRRGATAPDAPPAVAEPPPAAATTTPPPAAPVAPEAPAPPGTPAAAAPVSRLEDPLIDDFERGKDGDALGSWSTGSNEGATPATIVMGRVVRGLRDHALHLTARMGEGSAPFVRVVIPLASSGGPVDVSRFRGLRFDARGEGRYRIVFVTRSIADGRYHESYFSGSPNWTPVGIPFASIGQNGSGGHAPFTGRDLIEIRFEVARGPGQLAWLELDNVRFY
jgi:hypothetical protein